MNKVLASLVAASFLMTGAAMAQAPTPGSSPAAMTTSKTKAPHAKKVKASKKKAAAPATTAP